MTLEFEVLAAAQAIQEDVRAELGPPQEGRASATQSVVALSLVRGTRGYIERVANQANGAYENGWYDACAVMVRRLLETLIIEVFENHGLAPSIKDASGNFLRLGDLVDRCLQEPSWNLGRDSKQAMPRLKGIGDRSAHSRRFNAHRHDIDNALADIRVVLQELVYLAGLK